MSINCHTKSESDLLYNRNLSNWSLKPDFLLFKCMIVPLLIHKGYFVKKLSNIQKNLPFETPDLSAIIFVCFTFPNSNNLNIYLILCFLSFIISLNLIYSLNLKVYNLLTLLNIHYTETGHLCSFTFKNLCRCKINNNISLFPSV